MIEILLAIYLLSGSIKGFFIYNSVSTYVDITFLFAILLIIVFVLELLKQNNIIRLFRVPNAILFFLLFWGWILISLTYTSSCSYSITKTLYFSTNLVPIYFLLIKSESLNLRLFLKTFILLQLLLVLFYFPYAYQYYKTWNPELSDLTRMYLSLAENTGLIFLSIFLSKEYIFNKLLDYFLMICSLIFLIILGARGPILFVVLIVIINFLIRLKKISFLFDKRVLYISLLIIFIIAFILFIHWDSFYLLFKNSIFRIRIFFESILNPSNIKDSSISMRVELINKAFISIFSNLKVFFLGKGIGSFGIETFGIDSSIHPHNNFIEVLFELGFIGLIIYFIFILSILINLRINYKYISYFVVLYAMLNILKSSSLIDIRVMLSFIVINTIIVNKKIIN